ncbi:MAG: carbon-nitrogen hydrolase family protein [Marinobacterium sp.]|nr:carbon-nitrogen hydrolase family protein [Marinobacterium sp.]
MSTLTLAACQYEIEFFHNPRQSHQHLNNLVQQAVDQQAQLLLMPEYSAMALTSLQPENTRGDLQRSIAALQPQLPDWLEQCETLARQHQIWFCPGSAPVLQDGQYRNRAWLFGPDGLLGYQDKLIMTRFEREQWQIRAGNGLTVFDTPLGRLGILICYDNEFPNLARQLAEQDVDLILSPSCTDTEAGFNRVRIGAQARALENQIALLQSPTVGNAPWSPAVDINIGKAGLYTPPDYGLPADGILAQSPELEPSQNPWLICKLNLEALRDVRKNGQVATRRDWPEQFDSARLTPQRVR